MRTIKMFLLLAFIPLLNNMDGQTVVKMDMPQQAEKALEVVALFDEEIPEGVPVVLGLMGYDVEGGITPYLFEWVLNGIVVSTTDIAVFTPAKGDQLSLNITDQNKCRATTPFDLKIATLSQSKTEIIFISPTLVSDHIYVDFPANQNQKAWVRIFDINGTMTYQTEIISSEKISLNLPQGTYFVSVRVGGIHKVEKIIVR